MLDRLLQVRRGESTRAALLFTYLFLIIASSVVTKAARDPIFQEKFTSAGLPYVDMASALSVAAVMGIYLRISRRIGLRSLIVGTLLASAAATVGFWFIVRVREPLWMLPIFYIWASVSGVLLPAQVWTLANRVMTTREAKRLFGIVSGGAISGWIAGGLVTKTIATRLSAAALLLPTAGVLAICPVLVVALWRERKIDVPVRTDHEGQMPHGDSLYGIAESFAFIWRSPQLRAIAALVGVSSLVTTVVGWQFKAIAKDAIPHTDQLAAFYGTFNVYAGVLALVTQFLIASRFLRRLGIGAALLVVPVALMTSSIGLLLSGSLWAAILLKGSDQVVRYSIDKPAAELLYLAIPARHGPREKALIDTVVWRIGDGLGAALVLVCLSVAGLTASQISVVTLALLTAWMAASVVAARHYAYGLRASIYEHRLDAERLSHIPDRGTTHILAHSLDSSDSDEILCALTLLERHDPPMSHPAVGGLLVHAEAAVRQKAIAVLVAAEDATMLAQVEPLRGDDDAGVRAEALVYLARCGNVDPLTYVDDLGDVQGSALASAVAYFLARPGPAQNLDAVRVLLDAAIHNDAPDRHRARLEAARLVGSLPDQFEEQLKELLNDQSTDVVRLALRAAATVGKATAAPLIVARLADPELAADAADSLAIFGNRAIPALRDALENEECELAVRYAIPEVLHRIGTTEAEPLLVEHLLDRDPIFRLRALSALNKLRQETGNRRLEPDLVETVLTAEILGHYRSYQLLGRLPATDAIAGPVRRRVQESMDREVERIFRLMKLLLPQHDLHSAYFGLQSDDAVVHANALEFLEHVLPASLRATLLPLIDSEVSFEGRIAIADRVVGVAGETPEQARAALGAIEEQP